MNKLTRFSWALLISCVMPVALFAVEPLHGVIVSEGSRSPGDEAYLSGYSARPHVIGTTLTLNGSRLGIDKRQYKITYVGSDSVKRTISTRYIDSWQETQIRLRTPFSLTKEGRYYLQLEKGGRVYGALNFRTVLPTPRVLRYQTTNSCLGGNIIIHGEKFTVHKGAFSVLIQTRAPGSGSTFRSISIKNSDIRQWYKNRIKIHLNRSLRAYVKPGYTYRISLLKKLQRGYKTVATGPTGILSRNCTSPSDSRSGAPSAIGQQTYTATFTGLTLQRQVILGNSVRFRGFLKANSAAATRQYGARPMQVTFLLINKQTKVVVARKFIRMRRRQISFNISGIPRTTGEYILKPDGRSYGDSGYRINHPNVLSTVVRVINPRIRQRAIIYFTPANNVRRSSVGQWLYFGGVFVIKDQLFYRRLSAVGFTRIKWSVVSTAGRVAGRGVYSIRSKRSALIAKVRPREPGDYYLKLSFDPSSRIRFGLSSPNLRSRTVKVRGGLGSTRKSRY